ncbi:hypothetical protein CL621_02960 [archaeon]|nr:hypothetical protein [archaeon]|tara:strand:+ start:2498 stop:3064 length:567 start_codon:yes stop_codon:yes gene_type:complete
MKKGVNKRVLIPVFVVIFVVGLIFGSFSEATITGYGGGIWGPWQSRYTTKDWLLYGRGTNAITEISVSPSHVLPGEPITVSIDPGSEGARKEVKIYKVNEQGYGVLKKTTMRFYSSGIKTVQRGGFSIFENKTFNLYTSHSWSPGLYAVKVYDIKSNQYISGHFTIDYLNPRNEDVIRSGFKKIIYGG